MDTPNIPGQPPPTPDCPFHEEILPPDAQPAPNRGVESPAFSPAQPHKRCPRALPFFRPNPSSTSTSQKSWSRRLCTKPVCYKQNVALQRNSAGTRCFSNKGKTQIGLVLASSADSPGTKNSRHSLPSLRSSAWRVSCSYRPRRFTMAISILLPK